ncbi:hypothetical protein GDO86_004587 [Hymenochirus boettgeri]|uniref:Secreted protein n=1 Tax=Hymenochirus boettgeri TaxID=247094 RepID=A0A8T2K8Y6_9PIPI|nr:hypothetical protein GDO86_004587 [Hymenochirus boettgeri]
MNLLLWKCLKRVRLVAIGIATCATLVPPKSVSNYVDFCRISNNKSIMQTVNRFVPSVPAHLFAVVRGTLNSLQNFFLPLHTTVHKQILIVAC